jgi:hypothetical protein
MSNNVDFSGRRLRDNCAPVLAIYFCKIRKSLTSVLCDCVCRCGKARQCRCFNNPVLGVSRDEVEDRGKLFAKPFELLRRT